MPVQGKVLTPVAWFAWAGFRTVPSMPPSQRPLRSAVRCCGCHHRRMFMLWIALQQPETCLNKYKWRSQVGPGTVAEQGKRAPGIHPMFVQLTQGAAWCRSSAWMRSGGRLPAYGTVGTPKHSGPACSRRLPCKPARVEQPVPGQKRVPRRRPLRESRPIPLASGL